jgi:hypothetical protein
MVNKSTNINQANNHLSSQSIEHKQTTTTYESLTFKVHFLDGLNWHKNVVE